MSLSIPLQTPPERNLIRVIAPSQLTHALNARRQHKDRL